MDLLLVKEDMFYCTGVVLSTFFPDPLNPGTG